MSRFLVITMFLVQAYFIKAIYMYTSDHLIIQLSLSGPNVDAKVSHLVGIA